VRELVPDERVTAEYVAVTPGEYVNCVALVTVTVLPEPCAFKVTVPVPVPAPVAVKEVPTVLDPAPIRVKSVVPTVKMVTGTPDTSAVAAAVAEIVAVCPVISP